MNDEDYMRIAIKNAKNSKFPFGAVIVKNNKVIAEAGSGEDSLDPTSHAEISVIRKTCKKLKTNNLKDCTIYTTCEPCPMCTGAIWWANIKRLVYGISLKESSKLFGKEIDITSKYINKKGGNKINIQEGILKKEIKTLYNI